MGANKLDQVEYLAIQQADGAFLNQICNGDTGRIEPQECPQHGASCLEKEDGSPEYATLTVADLKERGKNFYEDYQTFVKRFAKSQSLDAKEQCTLNEFGLTHMAQIYDKDKDRFEVQGEDADKYNKMLELQAKYLSSIIFETDTLSLNLKNMEPNNEDDFEFVESHPRCTRLSQAFHQLTERFTCSENLDKTEYLTLASQLGVFSVMTCNSENGRIERNVEGENMLLEKGSLQEIQSGDLKQRGKHYQEAYQGFVEQFSKSQSLDAKERQELEKQCLKIMARVYDKNTDRFEYQAAHAIPLRELINKQAELLPDNYREE
ncbi:hypothetical protein DFQ28_003766, partial [Apophysomyces sp. BC1034]